MEKTPFLHPDPSKSSDFPQIDNGPIVIWLGRFVLIAGLITWFIGYVGRSNSYQMEIGISIAAVGITWWILGVILHTIEKK